MATILNFTKSTLNRKFLLWPQIHLRRATPRAAIFSSSVAKVGQTGRSPVFFKNLKMLQQ